MLVLQNCKSCKIIVKYFKDINVLKNDITTITFTNKYLRSHSKAQLT